MAEVRGLWKTFTALAMLAGAGSVHGVILFGTADPTAHTTAPDGEFRGSGWDTQIGPRYSGTAVGPSHVLTAAHLGMGTNTPFSFQGLGYLVLEWEDCPDTDLRLVRVGGRLPTWASPLSSTNEVGQGVVLFGRGGPRGPTVMGDLDGDRALRGWRWNLSDAQLRWGTNLIEGIETGSSANPGEYLVAWFTDDAGDDEATVSVGDSGGGVFLQESPGVWKLAGVVSAVQASFKSAPDASPFNAAVFDRRPFLEEESPGVWEYDPDRFQQPGTRWLATRVSAYSEWLNTRLAQPPAIPVPRLLSADTVDGTYSEHPAYSVNPSRRQIWIHPPENGRRFFRLEGSSTLAARRLEGGLLLLEY